MTLSLLLSEADPWQPQPGVGKGEIRFGFPLFLVPAAGFEPARPRGQGILSPLCLPFHHAGGMVRLHQRRTEVNPFSALHGKRRFHGESVLPGVGKRPFQCFETFVIYIDIH